MLPKLPDLNAFYRVILDLRSPHFDGREWAACITLYSSLYSRYCFTSIHKYNVFVDKCHV